MTDPQPSPVPVRPDPQPAVVAEVAAVVIGRNEGDRLVRCITSLQGRARRIVYVDSGSTDGSLAAAQRLGAEVVELDRSMPFTAARARNAGFARLSGTDGPAYVQFVDGDCEVQPAWLDTASAFLDTHPDIAVVCGRRRERFPSATLWNRLIDAEWEAAAGETLACGGDALMRRDAVAAAGGYNPALIAGEEPELCLRLRRAGWKIWRIEGEMTLHDAAMTRFAQWWQRSRRAGHTFAEGARMYGRAPERHKVAETRRALAWGMALPAATLLGTLATPWALLLLLAWPLQVLRLRIRGMDWLRAVFLTLAKLPEAQGALGYHLRRLRGDQARLIEYK